MEVAAFLGAGDSESKPEELLRTPGINIGNGNAPSAPLTYPMPSPMLQIPQRDMAKMTERLNLPTDRIGFQLPPGFG